MDERLSALYHWIQETLGFDVVIEPASEDASFRRYFRVFYPENETLIAMDAPPARESVATFVRAASLFETTGINVPQVFAVDKQLGFALISDFGVTTMLQILNEQTVETLYEDAMTALLQLQHGSTGRPAAFEAYDRRKLVDEMELFRQWYAPHQTEYVLQPEDHEVIDETFELLTDAALEQPVVWVHRDYHSRNLLVTEQRSPGVIDFQDAVNGPVTYDLVSLLRDCYIEWPDDRVRGWALAYLKRLQSSDLCCDVDEARFLRWFDWMGLQRHIKVLGIFSRLYHRDGKENYLKDLPLVYKYALNVSSVYKQLRPFADLLSQMTLSWKH